MYNIKKVILICLIALLVVIPTAYASNNQTDFELNDNILSDSYYFDANVDVSGNGSLNSPYKTLRNNVHDDSVIYLNEGIYSGYSIEVNNITIIGKSSENTIIKNMNIDVDGSLVICNVTFMNSRITNGGSITLINSIFKDSYASIGGFLSSSNSSVNITNCTFTNIHATNYAGVIYATNSNLNIADSVFSGNYANYYAGVIYCDKNSKVTISNTNFTNNQAKNDAGGVIYGRDSEIIANYVSFSNSSATFGGAITALNTNLNLTNIDARDNKAKYRGGSIYSVYGDYTIVNSTFENNVASDGGAIFVDSPDLLTVSSNKFINNSALNVGGGVYIISNETYVILNISFLNNSASINNDIYETILPNLTIGNGDYILIYYNQSYDGDLPSSYDLRTLNQVTSVKNQGNGGNCWSFAALASLESCILKATGNAYDLSEENMKNLMSLYSEYGWDITPNDGGYIAMGIGYLTSWLGPVNESDDSYYGSSALSPVLNSFIHVQNILFLKRTSYTDNNEIKRAIIEQGAVSTSIYWDKNSYANGKNYYNYDHTSSANHAVVIVGWDNNYSKTNFKKIAPGDGAWIIKNSWGTSGGENGYYYVSYYDVSLAPLNNPSSTYTFVLADSIKYDKNYQYDIPGQTDYLLNSSSSVWYKNKFTATDDEYLTAVSTYFQKDTTWDLYIYVNDELKLIQSGNAVASYSTIELNQFIPLKIGDDFEVVFKITVEGNAGVPISEIISLNNLFYGENISYISYDGENWNDLFNLTWTYPNHSYKSQVACIKAFTVLNKINSTVTLTINDECNPVEIIATVLNQYGNPVNSGQVIFNIEGNEYTVDIINGISKLNYIFKNSGVKLIKVSFNSDKYTGSSSNITIHSKQVSIVANDMVSCHNGTFYYSIRLIDDDSNPVANKEIKFKINDKVYVVSTDSNGIAKVSLKLAFGSYNIEIGFNDVINNEGYNLTKKITLKSSITTLANEVYAYNSNYKVILLDNYGKRLSNCNVEIIVNGITEYLGTDDEGVLNYNIELSPGSYSITVINPETGGKSIQNIKVVSRMTGNKDITKYFSVVSYYKVKVVDDNGKIKKNLKVTIKLNGKTYYKYTDSHGYVSLKISSLKAGKYTITATYNGFKVSNKITVKHNVITKDMAIKKGKTGKFTAKIVDSKGNILKYKIVTFKFRGKTYKVKTNKYGVATLKIAKKTKITKYSITTTYGRETVKNTISIVK